MSRVILCHFIVVLFSMKTGLLKWKPDYEGASVEYGKAGKFDVYSDA